MAKSIIDITKNYTQLSAAIKGYLRRIGHPKYSESKFAWFRPEGVTDTSDLKQITAPFKYEELTEAAKLLVQQADMETVNNGDYAMVVMQQDLIISTNRSFASRYRSKLRHFASAAGVQERVGHEFGTIHYSYDEVITNTKRLAAGN